MTRPLAGTTVGLSGTFVEDDELQLRMPTPCHLTRAPIVEAVIDFRTKLPKDFTLAKFSNLKSTLGDRFPTVKETRLLQSLIKFEPGKAISQTETNEEIQGLQFWSSDNLRIAHFRIDGFSFSRLQPYTSWEEVFKEATAMWELYIKTTGSEGVTRLAVRYINRWQIPAQRAVENHLAAPPRLPNELQWKRPVDTFLSRIVIHDSDQKIRANLIQASEPGTAPQLTTVVLDIDVYKEDDFNVSGSEIKLAFEALRTMKNRIFFSSITEEAKAMFI